MSGGSFNYLFRQEPYEPWELQRMADELRRRGMDEAAAETEALLPRQARAELADLWKAVEWNVSGDGSEADVARSYTHFLQASET